MQRGQQQLHQQRTRPIGASERVLRLMEQRLAESRQKALELLERRRAFARGGESTSMGAAPAETKPPALSDEQRAAMAASLRAAQERRAGLELKRRQAAVENERKAVAAKHGPLAASFFVVAKKGMQQQQQQQQAQQARDDSSSAAVASSSSTPLADSSGGGGGDAAGGGVGAGVVVDSRTSEEVLSNAQINSVFEKIASTAETLPAVEPPPTLLSISLRPYQRQALAWMVQRESEEDAERAAEAAWHKYALPDGTHFFVHAASGAASLQRPRALGAARGGILADSMVPRFEHRTLLSFAPPPSVPPLALPSPSRSLTLLSNNQL